MPPFYPYITLVVKESTNYAPAEVWVWGIESENRFTLQCEDGQGDSLPPPWNLSAPDPSRLRSDSDKAAIWQAYEELVAYAAANLTVVTSEDIVEMAK